MGKHCGIFADSMHMSCTNNNNWTCLGITIQLSTSLRIKDLKFCAAFNTSAMPTLLSKSAIIATFEYIYPMLTIYMWQNTLQSGLHSLRVSTRKYRFDSRASTPTGFNNNLTYVFNAHWIYLYKFQSHL